MIWTYDDMKDVHIMTNHYLNIEDREDNYACAGVDKDAPPRFNYPGVDVSLSGRR